MALPQQYVLYEPTVATSTPAGGDADDTHALAAGTDADTGADAVGVVHFTRVRYSQ